jgi:hypothetical protein
VLDAVEWIVGEEGPLLHRCETCAGCGGKRVSAGHLRARDVRNAESFSRFVPVRHFAGNRYDANRNHSAFVPGGDGMNRCGINLNCWLHGNAFSQYPAFLLSISSCIGPPAGGIPQAGPSPVPAKFRPKLRPNLPNLFALLAVRHSPLVTFADSAPMRRSTRT